MDHNAIVRNSTTQGNTNDMSSVQIFNQQAKSWKHNEIQSEEYVCIF